MLGLDPSFVGWSLLILSSFNFCIRVGMGSFLFFPKR